MGIKRKVGIGFGIIAWLFFALVIIAVISMEMEKANMTPEERQWRDDERDAKELQVKIDAEQEEKIRAMEEEQERVQKEINAKQEEKEAKQATADMIKRLSQNQKERLLAEAKKLERVAREAQEAVLDTKEKVLEFVQNYKGKDNAGSTLDQTMTTLLNAAYPGEDIISSPSTTGGYIASRDYDKEISDRYWKVELMIKTYREAIHYEWVVDTETNLIYPKDGGAKSVLDILDSFD